MANSRAKGARGELEAVAVLDAMGFDCRRTVQYNGKAGDADVVCEGLPVHFEVKRTERLSPYQFMDQAIRDAKARNIPCVMMKSNNKPWLVTVRAVDLIALAEALINARRFQAHDQQPEAL